MWTHCRYITRTGCTADDPEEGNDEFRMAAVSVTKSRHPYTLRVCGVLPSPSTNLFYNLELVKGNHGYYITNIKEIMRIKFDAEYRLKIAVQEPSMDIAQLKKDAMLFFASDAYFFLARYYPPAAVRDISPEEQLNLARRLIADPYQLCLEYHPTAGFLSPESYRKRAEESEAHSQSPSPPHTNVNKAMTKARIYQHAYMLTLKGVLRHSKQEEPNKVVLSELIASGLIEECDHGSSYQIGDLSHVIVECISHLSSITEPVGATPPAASSMDMNVKEGQTADAIADHIRDSTLPLCIFRYTSLTLASGMVEAFSEHSYVVTQEGWAHHGSTILAGHVEKGMGCNCKNRSCELAAAKIKGGATSDPITSLVLWDMGCMSLETIEQCLMTVRRYYRNVRKVVFAVCMDTTALRTTSETISACATVLGCLRVSTGENRFSLLTQFHAGLRSYMQMTGDTCGRNINLFPSYSQAQQKNAHLPLHSLQRLMLTRCNLQPKRNSFSTTLNENASMCLIGLSSMEEAIWYCRNTDNSDRRSHRFVAFTPHMKCFTRDRIADIVCSSEDVDDDGNMINNALYRTVSSACVMRNTLTYMYPFDSPKTIDACCTYYRDVPEQREAFVKLSASGADLFVYSDGIPIPGSHRSQEKHPKTGIRYECLSSVMAMVETGGQCDNYDVKSLTFKPKIQSECLVPACSTTDCSGVGLSPDASASVRNAVAAEMPTKWGCGGTATPAKSRAIEYNASLFVLDSSDCVLFDEPVCDMVDTVFVMLEHHSSQVRINRKQLYTAMKSARNQVVFVGSMKVLRDCLKANVK